MGYTNGLDREAFLQHMYDEFPGVFNNSFAREMLENIVDYGTADNFTHTKNELYYFLKDMIPEIEPKDLVPFLDKNVLTNEVLSLVDHGDAELRTLIETNVERDALLNLFEFIPGFHEWTLTFDGENVWTLDDGSGRVAEFLSDADVAVLNDYVDTCIEEVKLVVAENGVFEFDAADYEIMREKMVKAFGAHYGIEGKTVVRTMDELKGYLEEKGWEVSEGVGVNSRQITVPQWQIATEAFDGDSWGITIYHQGDVAEMIQKLRKIADTFDAKSDAEVWATESEVRLSRALVEAMEKVGEKLKELAGGVVAEETPNKVDGLIADAAAKCEGLSNNEVHKAVVDFGRE